MDGFGIQTAESAEVTLYRSVTRMLSNVPVASAPSVWLETARPTWTAPTIDSVSFPTVRHVVPSGDTDAVMIWPTRVSFTHWGAVPMPPLVSTEVPPVTGRRWNLNPFPTETSIIACAEPASSVCRIITPTFVHACGPLTE